MTANANFNMITQFGGGKTHSLALLWHLAQAGEQSQQYAGVGRIMAKAGIRVMPRARLAVFVGQSFDERTGDDGVVRETIWGEIAYQLAGEAGYRLIERFDKSKQSPGDETIRALFELVGEPCLILIDELMRYVSRVKASVPVSQIDAFVQGLTEVARGMNNVVLVIAMPSSDNISGDDVTHFATLSKTLNRLSKFVLVSANTEIAEIIRRRLFDWQDSDLDENGRIILPKSAEQSCLRYAEWTREHQGEFGFPIAESEIKREFLSSYPFHPRVLKVFADKWQTIEKFQQTRGILRILAMWIAHAHKSSRPEALITLGTAPMDDANFRTALFQQLGEERLEGIVTADIAGSTSSHAVILDSRSEHSEVKKRQLHSKIATVIFIESNGGMAKEKSLATVAEIRYGVAELDLNVNLIETALEALTDLCYYLSPEKNTYRFTLKENLNKRFRDRQASLKNESIEQELKGVIKRTFQRPSNARSYECRFFPQKGEDIPDIPALQFIFLLPHQAAKDTQTDEMIQDMTEMYGSQHRKFRNGLVWITTDMVNNSITEAARKIEAWKAVQDDVTGLDDIEQQQLSTNIKKSQTELTNAISQTYRKVYFLKEDNTIQSKDIVSASSIASIIEALRQGDDIAEAIGVGKLLSNWVSTDAWNLKSVRDAFYSSPKLSRLIDAEKIKDAIVRAVKNGECGLAMLNPDGTYRTIHFRKDIEPADIDFSDDMCLLKPEAVNLHFSNQSAKKNAPTKPIVEIIEDSNPMESDEVTNDIVAENSSKPILGIEWNSEIDINQWSAVGTKILTKFKNLGTVRISISVKLHGEKEISDLTIKEIQNASRELKLSDSIKTTL
jgi:hypothetical protein